MPVVDDDVIFSNYLTPVGYRQIYRYEDSIRCVVMTKPSRINVFVGDS